MLSRTWALLLVGGTGSRVGAEVPKQFVEVAGHSLVAWAFDAMDRAFDLAGMVVVAAAAHRRVTENLLACRTRRCRLLRTVDGGPTRQSSVACGLAAVPDECDGILVHDGARPFIGKLVAERLLAGLSRAEAVVPGIAHSDTLKRVGFAGEVLETLDRERVLRIQTPQLFVAGVLRRAHDSAAANGFEGTDDAQLVERCGVTVLVVEGDELNLKVTTKRDIFLMQCVVDAARVVPGCGPPAGQW